MISPREHRGPLSGRYNDLMLSLAPLCLEKQKQAAEDVLLCLWQWLEYSYCKFVPSSSVKQPEHKLGMRLKWAPKALQ
jgi:hypothetical protein